MHSIDINTVVENLDSKVGNRRAVPYRPARRCTEIICKQRGQGRSAFPLHASAIDLSAATSLWRVESFSWDDGYR